MKLLLLSVLLAYVMLIRAGKEEEQVPSLIEGIKENFKRMSKSYDECKWGIEGGEAGLEDFFKNAIKEYRANKEGEKNVFSCTVVKNGMFNGDYLRIKWGPGKPPVNFDMIG